MKKWPRIYTNRWLVIKKKMWSKIYVKMWSKTYINKRWLEIKMKLWSKIYLKMWSKIYLKMWSKTYINKRWSHRPTAPFAPGQGLPYSRDDLFLCFFSEMFRSCSRSVNVSRSGLSPRTVSPSVGARPPVETANASNELRRRRRC